MKYIVEVEDGLDTSAIDISDALSDWMPKIISVIDVSELSGVSNLPANTI